MSQRKKNVDGAETNRKEMMKGFMGCHKEFENTE